MPGWYPDPAGQPGRFRYWDGHAWSQQTTGDPRSTPAPGTGPASAGAPRGPSSRGPSSRGTGGRRGRGPLVAAIAVLLLAALLLWWLLARGGSNPASAPEDRDTSTPIVSAWNETSKPSASPSASSPRPSGGALTSCPDTGGNAVFASHGVIQGGGLTASAVPGWRVSTDFSMVWAHNTESYSSTVRSSGVASWFSVVSLSSLDRSDGFTSPQQAARGVMDCFASSSYYASFTGRDNETDTDVTINAHHGFHVQAQVHVDDPHFPGIAGDVVDVIVVDTGDPATFALFVSSYTIGDTTRQQQVETCIGTLH